MRNPKVNVADKIVRQNTKSGEKRMNKVRDFEDIEDKVFSTL